MRWIVVAIVSARVFLQLLVNLQSRQEGMCKDNKALDSSLLRLVGLSPVPFPACCQPYPPPPSQTVFQSRVQRSRGDSVALEKCVSAANVRGVSP